VLGLYLAEDRIRMVVQYVPEPILGEAACQALYKGPGGMAFREDLLAEHVRTFVNKCISGQVHAGTIGEILARILLSLAHDQVQLRRPGIGGESFFSQPIGLRAFLDMLLLSDEGYAGEFRRLFGGSPVDIPPGLEDGKVCFTNWTSMRTFSKTAALSEYLALCYERRSAVILPPNQQGADLLIPVKYPSAGGQGAGAAYSYILVQVKNRVSLASARFHYAGKELSPCNVFGPRKKAVWQCAYTPTDPAISHAPPYVALYLEMVPDTIGTLMAGADRDECRAFKSEYPHHGLMLGFGHLSRSASLFQAFKALHRRHIEDVDDYARMTVLKCLAFLDFYFFNAVCKCTATDCCRQEPCSCAKAGLACNPACSCKDNCANPNDNY
jgi:hypothetical protein